MARLDLVGTLTPVYNLAGTLTNTGSLSGTLSFTGIQYLDDLLDVDISMPTNGDVLMYDGSKWVNAAGGGGTSNYNDLNNKPSINSVVLQGDRTTQDLGISYNDLTNLPVIPAAQVNADWDAVSGVEEILNKPTLSTVATSGSYNDLTDKPTIPAAQVNSDWDAVSGVAQILNKPTIPSNLYQLSDVHYDPDDMFNDDILIWVNGGWYASTQSYQLLANKPEINGHTLTGNQTTQDLGISYNDLTDLPTIPAAQVNSDWNAISGVSEILNKPSLATVATSGSYNDLIDKPTIPTGLHEYSTTEQQVGVWVDGTTPVYEKTYTFNSAISCAAGNTSAAGAWTSLTPWNDSITIIDFKAWSNSGNAKSVWTHLSAQWSNTALDIRALNVRSTAAPVDGFTMRYFYNV